MVGTLYGTLELQATATALVVGRLKGVNGHEKLTHFGHQKLTHLAAVA